MGAARSHLQTSGNSLNGTIRTTACIAKEMTATDHAGDRKPVDAFCPAPFVRLVVSKRHTATPCWGTREPIGRVREDDPFETAAGRSSILSAAERAPAGWDCALSAGSGRPEQRSRQGLAGVDMFSGFRHALGDLSGALVPLAVRDLQSELEEALRKAPRQLNDYGYDPFGFSPKTASRIAFPFALLYRYYFRAETHGIEQVPRGRALLIANHAGQMPYDGVMLAVAMLLDASPPRLARGMGEYFIWKIPWMGLTASRGGTIVGTPENCVTMLEAEECVMAFPEGARGINKPFNRRYRLERFGLGFMRLALETGTPIVPVGFVGSEEQQPGLANLRGVAEIVGLPSLPITLSFPWLGPLGLMLALPVKTYRQNVLLLSQIILSIRGHIIIYY